MIDRGKEFNISYPLISSLLSFRKAEQIRMKEWAPCCYIEVKVSVIPRQNLLYFRVDGSPTTRTQPRQDFSCACVILFISALTLLWPRASGLWNVEMACVKSKREGRENVWEQKHMLLMGVNGLKGKDIVKVQNHCKKCIGSSLPNVVWKNESRSVILNLVSYLSPRLQQQL